MEFTKRRNVNRGYMKLDVWVQAQALVKLTKELLDRSPGLGFKLRDQILDACCSCPANISEGYCRRSINEYVQFCYIALASIGEALSRMVSLRVGELITPADFESFDVLHWGVENRLIGLVRSLEAKRRGGTWNQEMP